MADQLKQVLEQIKEEVERQEDIVEDISLDSVAFDKFTPEITKELEKYKDTLICLSFNECELKSLENFPTCPQLLRLELTDNHLTGEDLKHLKNLRNIEALYLGGNKIAEYKELEALAGLNSLLELDLFECPISNKTDYPKKVFEILPKLQILDGKDKDGKAVEEEGDIEDGDGDGEAFDDDEEEDYDGSEDHPDFTLREDEIGAGEEGGLEEQDELSDDGSKERDEVEYEDVDAYEEVKKKRKTQ